MGGNGRIRIACKIYNNVTLYLLIQIFIWILVFHQYWIIKKLIHLH